MGGGVANIIEEIFIIVFRSLALLKDYSLEQKELITGATSAVTLHRNLNPVNKETCQSVEHKTGSLL